MSNIKFMIAIDNSMIPILATKIRSKMAAVSFFWQLNCSCCCHSAPSCEDGMTSP